MPMNPFSNAIGGDRIASLGDKTAKRPKLMGLGGGGAARPRVGGRGRKPAGRPGIQGLLGGKPKRVRRRKAPAGPSAGGMRPSF